VIAVFLILLALDLLVTVVRASLLNARLPFLLNLRERHGTSVDRTAVLLERPRLRASLRLAITILHFLLAATGLFFFQTLVAGPYSLAAFLGIMLLAGGVLLLIEFAIEGRVFRNPEEVALRVAPLGQLIDFFLTPFSILLLALWGHPGYPQKGMTSVTEDALRIWVEEGQSQGSLEKDERKMIYSIFQFRETLVREVMVPRIDICSLEVNTPWPEVIEALTSSGHSRVPVYEENIDNIIGMLYAKDLINEKDLYASPGLFREILRPAYFVPEAKKVEELMTEMQARRVHVAIVVDEYGGVAGMVSLEDILEEIIGEIRDEYDQAEELLYQQIASHEFIFQGRVVLDSFNEVMDAHLDKETADTLGGFISHQLGRVPAGGDRVETEEVILEVEQVNGRRIRRVRAWRKEPAGSKEMEGKDDVKR
jgi:putative hemolysin